MLLSLISFARVLVACSLPAAEWSGQEPRSIGDGQQPEEQHAVLQLPGAAHQLTQPERRHQWNWTHAPDLRHFVRHICHDHCWGQTVHNFCGSLSCVHSTLFECEVVWQGGVISKQISCALPNGAGLFQPVQVNVSSQTSNTVTFDYAGIITGAKMISTPCPFPSFCPSFPATLLDHLQVWVAWRRRKVVVCCK